MSRSCLDAFSLQLYNESGDDELNKEEFIEVLKATGVTPRTGGQAKLSAILSLSWENAVSIFCPGFEEAEADAIFDEVNADGGPGVSVDEFEEWWLKSSRASNVSGLVSERFDLSSSPSSPIMVLHA